MHVREIARVTGSSPGAMAKELDQLQRAGLLQKHQVGNQVHFSANQKHPVFPELSGLLRKTVGIAEVLAAAILPLEEVIDVAFVFGSIARGTEHSASDIDVAVIGRADFAMVLDALYPAQEILKREINPQIFSAAEWREKRASGSTFLKELVEQPKIFLMGTEDDLELLG